MILLWFLLAPLAMAEAPLGLSIPSGAEEPVNFAAGELSRYLEAATGLPVIIEEDSALEGQYALVLSIPGAATVQPEAPESLHEEAYRIHAIPGGGRAFQGNSPRALLYAVYDFLENDLGYRWYFPYPEDNIAPRMTPEDFFALLRHGEDREIHPAFEFREREFRDVSPDTVHTDDRIVQQIDWWAKLRMNRFLLNFHYAGDTERWARWRQRLIPEIKRRGMLVRLGEHGSYPLFLPPARYAEAHPEWYCEIDGQRIGGMRTATGGEAQFCTTNPGAVKTYLDNFAAFVQAHPEVDFYYPAPNDVGKWCECRQCRDLSIADRYLELNNRIAERLNEVKPGLRIMHLAYSNHRIPPETAQPHPMIDIDVACWGRDFSYPLCDPRTLPEDADYLDVFRQWAEICRHSPGDPRPRLLYHCKLMRHYWLGLQLLPLPVIDGDFNCARELGIDGFDYPLGFLGIWTKALNAYVVANKTWNPDLSPETMTKRFMQDYYGDYAPQAARAYELAADAFRDRRYGRSLTLAWFPDTSKVRDTPLEGLGDNARHAVARLDEALEILAGTLDAPPPFAHRIGKLHIVLRHARDEQAVLIQLDTLMHAAAQLRNAPSPDTRLAARQAWQETNAALDTLTGRYCIEEDEAGLYWGGASYRQLHDALDAWRMAIEEMKWHPIGHWETDDFGDSTEPIEKSFDITPLLKKAGPLQVRFQYRSGELGASLRAVSLWKRSGNGAETMLAEDRHGGFAGYVHENAVYRLHLDTAPEPNAVYWIKTELAAYATTGSVAERGSEGDVLLGLVP